MAPLLEVQWAPFFISTLYTYTASTKTQGHKSWAKDTGCAHPIHSITFHKVVVCTAAYHSDQWGSHLSDSVPGVPISRASATQRQFHLTVCDWLNIGWEREPDDHFWLLTREGHFTPLFRKLICLFLKIYRIIQDKFVELKSENNCDKKLPKGNSSSEIYWK